MELALEPAAASALLRWPRSTSPRWSALIVGIAVCNGQEVDRSSGAAISHGKKFQLAERLVDLPMNLGLPTTERKGAVAKLEMVLVTNIVDDDGNQLWLILPTVRSQRKPSCGSHREIRESS